MSASIEHTHVEPSHGHGGPNIYMRTLVGLLILTAITVAAAGVNFGSGNVVIALTIATVKAILVALFFMHLLYEKRVNSIIAVAGFLFLGIFLMFSLLDTETRIPLEPRNMTNMERSTPPVQTVGPGYPKAPPAAPAPAGEHK